MINDLYIDLKPGDIFAQRYEIIRKLATGRTGIVYACRHIDFDGRLEAVKILFPYIAEDKTALARLQREVTASYLITHKNILRTYEFLHEGDLYGFSMEYVDGISLKSYILRKTRLPEEEVATILLQTCKAVQAIHNVKMIHRNIKPENIMLTQDLNVKLGDFGIVKQLSAPPLTEEGGIVGTISHMSPEYIRTGEVTPLLDIFALGVTAYEMIVGSLPEIKSQSTIDFIKKRATSNSIFGHIQNCSAELEHIVRTAMAVNPKNRYITTAMMIHDLEKLVKSAPSKTEVIHSIRTTPISKVQNY